MTVRLLEWTRPWPWPWILFAAALGARLVYILQGYEIPPQDTPDYDEIALNLLRGDGFVARDNWFGFELRSWRPPFYPFFLALVYGVWGHSHQAVQLVQAIIGAGTVVLVYDLARRLHPQSALLAGLLATVYGPLVTISAEVMTETWFTFLLVLSAWFLVDATGADRMSRRSLLAGGVAIGLAALTRPVGLLFLPAFALATFWHRGPQSLRRTLWVTLAVCCTILPWSLRNYQVHRAWVPISTHGGFILSRSNAAEPAWRQEHGWGIEESFFHQIPSETERDRYWFRQGISFIRSHPGTYLKLAAERFLRFWYFLRPEYNFWFVLILPFCLVGLWRYGRTEGFLLLSSFAGISLLIFSFVLYGSTRFRLPLEPFFLLFAAAFIRDAWNCSRRTSGMLAAALLVNLLLYWGDEPLRDLVLNLLREWNLK